ncbi:MAG: bifunctional ornithine acetyltransferase/N-acetylglutamate synthase [Oscillospiraceae bacterium]|nr:bifunctional ornithine acetyltransferase/N-acetylglutamate synthase [Oscillospiraceae bacterium]
MNFINGGITAVTGFQTAGIHAGIYKDSSKLDLALIVSDTPCVAAATYTQNVVKADPVKLTQKNLANGTARAIVVNSGNANACAPDGMMNATMVCQMTAEVLGIAPEDIAVASTGVIGQRLPVEKIVAALSPLAEKLSPYGSIDAAQAIMTTDTIPKQNAVIVSIGGKRVTIGAIAKGVGMMKPNMATMLAFIATDCAISRKMLQNALRHVVDRTFNCVSVDGDTSTNDMVILLSNGRADNACIESENEDYARFVEALQALCRKLARMMAADGEGATKLITAKVGGAANEHDALTLAKSVVDSSLVKAAIFGSDANWGRVLCAMGYAGVHFDQNGVEVAFSDDIQTIVVCQNGKGLNFDEELARKILEHDDIDIDIQLNEGAAYGEAYGCDLTYEYVKINGEYRS